MPFRLNADLPLGMTAHVVFEAVDRALPATQSATVIGDIIRRAIGFRGLLLSDDLGMKALKGSFGDRTTQCLAAGCDLALHGSGDAAETSAVLDAAGELPDAIADRLTTELARVERASFSTRGVALARLNELLAVA